MTDEHPRKLLICSSFDSFIKASYSVCDVFEENGYAVDYLLINERGVVDKKHLAEIGFMRDFESATMTRIFDTDYLAEYQAIMLSLKGPVLFEIMSRLQDLDWPTEKRPIFFGGYCGIVYENFALGLLARQPLDVFFVNSRHDYDLFQRLLEEFGVPDSSNIYLTGLPLLDLSFNCAVPTESGEIKSLLFAGQPTVPDSLTERACIVHFLVEYCEKYPERTIYLKPRHKPNQDSVHKTLFHYQRILESIEKKRSLPPNLILTYDSILELLERVDLCLTVSSTAAFEAVNKGVPVGFLIDFGIREDYGTTYFVGSGCAVNLNDIMAGKTITPNLAWWRERYLSDGNNTQRLFSAVDELVDKITNSKDFVPFQYNYKKEIGKYYEDYKSKDLKLGYRSTMRNFLLKVYYYLKIKGIVE